MMSLQKDIQHGEPLPKNYTYVEKGNQYRTLNWSVNVIHPTRLGLTNYSSSKMTRKEGLVLYIVKENNKRIGIACPARIWRQVLLDERATRPARERQAAERHRRERDDAGRALVEQFPAMPSASARKLLQSAWKVGSGRVGRTGTLDMADKVWLAVQAYARHRCTDYDARLARGESRGAAREATKNAVAGQMRCWKGLSETTAVPSKEGKQGGRRRKKKSRHASNARILTTRKSVQSVKGAKKRPSQEPLEDAKARMDQRSNGC
jgi:hypothetical protein